MAKIKQQFLDDITNVNVKDMKEVLTTMINKSAKGVVELSKIISHGGLSQDEVKDALTQILLNGTIIGEQAVVHSILEEDTDE